MSNQKVQMNVRVPKELKNFAINDAKNQFHSLSQYIEKLMFKAKELSELEKRCEPPRLYRRVIYLSQAAMPDRVKLS